MCSADSPADALAHPFPPVLNAASRLLILGTFPSEASRREGFYYGHPRNRFWRVLAGVLELPVPGSVEEKRALLLGSGIALWDVLESCEIRGSADAAIRRPVPNRIRELLDGCAVSRIALNGQKAGALYQKHCAGGISLPFVVLPSTSPANAAWSLARLIMAWKCGLGL